jgi:hypothetical protein
MWRKIHTKYDNIKHPSYRCKVISFRCYVLTSSKSGDKCKHAHDWGIDVVNHLWLEETYAKWQVQSVTIPRYTHFPPQTNLTEIIDKTEIQEEGIQDFFTAREDDDDEEMTEIKPAAVAKVQSSYVTSEANKTPAPPSKKSPPLDTPGTESMRGTPGSSKRKAAENAMTKLHNEIMPDVLLWEKEKNRKRFPEQPARNEEVEKKKKAEKRKVEEKENLVHEVATKKAKKDVESKQVIENKVTLLVTGASEDFMNVTSVKVSH